MKNGNIFWKKTEIISIQLVMVQLRFSVLVRFANF